MRKGFSIWSYSHCFLPFSAVLNNPTTTILVIFLTHLLKPFPINKQFKTNPILLDPALQPLRNLKLTLKPKAPTSAATYTIALNLSSSSTFTTRSELNSTMYRSTVCWRVR